jgi:hypothetical protein
MSDHPLSALKRGSGLNRHGPGPLGSALVEDQPGEERGILGHVGLAI